MINLKYNLKHFIAAMIIGLMIGGTNGLYATDNAKNSPVEKKAGKVDVKPDRTLTLAEAIQTGLKNNFQIRIANQETLVGKNNNSWGAAGRYPTLNIGATESLKHTNTPSTTNPDKRISESSDSLSSFIELNWTLFEGFKIKFSKQKLALLEKQGKNNALSIIENSIRDITLAYYNVLLQQEKLTVMENMMNLSKDRYDKEVERKKFGSSTTFDILQIKTAWLDDESSYLLQQSSVNTTIRNLNRLMGNTETIRYHLTGTLKTDTPLLDLDSLKKQLLSNNRTLKNLDINRNILSKDIAIQKSALYPRISLNSGIQRNDSNSIYTYNYYANIGVTLNLFNGGNTKRAIANANINKRIGDLRLQETQIQLTNQLSNLYDLFTARKQVLAVAEEQIKSASLSLQLSDEKLKTGAINSFNFRDVQLSYLDAALNKLQAIYNLIDTLTELNVLTGTIAK